jgi:hypothetical protein
MDLQNDIAVRDRALRVVRRATITAICSVVGLSGIFSAAAAFTFSGKPAAAHHEAPPVVPSAAAPEQKPAPAPIVVTQVVHISLGYGSYTGGGASSGGGSASYAPPAAAPAPGAPAPPAAAPPPPPPPPPACVSTPSKPC